MPKLQLILAGCIILVAVFLLWLASLVSAHPHPSAQDAPQATNAPEDASVQRQEAENGSQRRTGRPTLALGEFERRCRPLVPVLYEAWMHHNPQWERFFPGFVFLVALESGCRPDVVNAIDAAGLAQLLKTAASDCRRAGLSGSRRDAVFGAECGAFIMARNGRIWRSHRSDECRMVLVWASHLTGAGWPIAAQKVARRHGATATCFWNGIGEYLNRVISEANAEHAWDYVGWIAHHSGIATDKVPRGNLGVR